MNKKRLFLFVALSIVTGSVFSGSITHAAPVTGFQAGRIIDDSIFTAKDSMNPGQIQSFLNSKVPNCDTNGTQTSEYGGGTRAQWGQAKYGQNTFTCLRDYNENGKSAAQLIYDKAQAYSINPQVLIVLLQKEQGLITDTWPLNIQYRSATGYGCPDTAACDSQYYGLTNQIDWAAKMFRAIMNASPTWYTPYILGNNNIRYSPNINCGSSVVNIQNRATQGLYNYTPYQPNADSLNAGYGDAAGDCDSHGNRNFYLYFSDWFGATTTGTKLPIVYKSQNSNELYAVWAGVKYYIPTYDVMIAWGLHTQPVNTVSDAFIASLSTGPNLSNIAKMSDDPASPLFLFDDGKRYPIPGKACAKNIEGTVNPSTTWGLDCFNTAVSKSYPKAFIENNTVQDITLPEMIAYQDSVWKLEGGKKRRIIDSYVVDVLGGWNNVRWMKDLNAQQQTGKFLARNGYPIQFSDGDKTISVYESNQLTPVHSYDAFISYNVHKNLHAIPSSYNTPDPLTVGAELTQMATDGANYYVVDKGFKMPIGSDTAQWPTTSASFAPGLLGSLTSIPLSNVYLSDASGEIFTVYDRKRYVFPTMDDFFRLGFNAATIRRVSGIIENLPGMTYGGMHMANNHLYKINNDLNQIYIVKNSISLKVNSINYPGLEYSKLITVDPITAARYPLAGTYTP